MQTGYDGKSEMVSQRRKKDALPGTDLHELVPPRLREPACHVRLPVHCETDRPSAFPELPKVGRLTLRLNQISILYHDRNLRVAIPAHGSDE